MILSSLLSPYALLLLPFLLYLFPYLRNRSIRDIPGPRLAAVSNLWLMYQCRRGRRYLAVDEAHKKHGTFVRIQPDHVSVADPDAIHAIYGHGNGSLKRYGIQTALQHEAKPPDEYYDAFVSIQRGLFNTRDRAEHTRKRKTVSHTFSAKSIGQFEQYIHHNLEELVRQWDRISDDATKSGKPYAEIDGLHWFNYTAFDVIGDLAFGSPFGMLTRGADITEVRKPDGTVTHAPAIEVLNRRGEVSGTLGIYPALKPFAKHLPDPFFRHRVQAVQDLAGIAIARVNERVEAERKGQSSDRVDLLARLMEGRDENGNKLGPAELTAEALTQLIAGSDTTSNTSCALLFWVLKTKGVMERLQAELDGMMPNGGVPSYGTVKDLPYLQCVISETLRIHSTSSLGLPRICPDRATTIGDRTFPPGTVLSVPAYTIHHSKAIWGPDADSFRPERWAKGSVTERQRDSFVPFSYGPRACVGRNVAEMELALIVATVAANFDFELRQDELLTREGFLRKPLACLVGMRRRRRA